MELSRDEIITAYTSGLGPQIVFTDKPGKDSWLESGNEKTGGYNACNSGKYCYDQTNYSFNTPIEINIEMLKILNSASTDQEVEAALLMLSATITHEYVEYFANHSTTYQQKSSNGPVTAKFGADLAIEQIYDGKNPVFSEGYENAKDVAQSTNDKSTLPQKK